MVKKAVPQIRNLIDVPDEELKQAVMDMCNRLHIHGSGEGYSLYDSVLHEKTKVKKHKERYDDVLKNAG